MTRSNARRKAEAAAIASTLIVLGIGILALDTIGLKNLLGLVLLAPNSVMLGYNIYDKNAPDRYYSIGIHALLTAIALAILGVNPRYLAAALLFLTAGIIVALNTKQHT